MLKRILSTLTLTMMLMHAWTAEAQHASVSEYQVKAAFLYNFAKFIEWPERVDRTDSQEFVFGILGQDPFGSDISVIESKYVNGQILRVIQSNSLTELKNCRVLFISSSAENRLGEILEKLRGLPVLTVGDTQGFARGGVMINLFKKENRIHFEINPAAAERAGLRISSHLLRLARIIESGKEDE